MMVSNFADAIYWPQFVVAVMAAIIASQSLISGTFSIIQQSLSLGCFPRVKIVHTSIKYPGQVYIPEINFLLMISCIAVTAVFKTTIEIGNAYGNNPLIDGVKNSDICGMIILNFFNDYRDCSCNGDDYYIDFYGASHDNDMEDKHTFSYMLCPYCKFL
jgi:hypothetical protein